MLFLLLCKLCYMPKFVGPTNPTKYKRTLEKKKSSPVVESKGHETDAETNFALYLLTIFFKDLDLDS